MELPAVGELVWAAAAGGGGAGLGGRCRRWRRSCWVPLLAVAELVLAAACAPPRRRWCAWSRLLPPAPPPPPAPTRSSALSWRYWSGALEQLCHRGHGGAGRQRRWGGECRDRGGGGVGAIVAVIVGGVGGGGGGGGGWSSSKVGAASRAGHLSRRHRGAGRARPPGGRVDLAKPACPPPSGGCRPLRPPRLQTATAHTGCASRWSPPPRGRCHADGAWSGMVVPPPRRGAAFPAGARAGGVAFTAGGGGGGSGGNDGGGGSGGNDGGRGPWSRTSKVRFTPDVAATSVGTLFWRASCESLPLRSAAATVQRLLGRGARAPLCRRCG